MQKKSHLKLLLISTLILFTVIEISIASPSDKIIIQTIERQAFDTFKIRLKNVNIAVENGYVVLYGSVNKYIQKMIYEKIAWKTEGVIEVENEIQVITILSQTDADIERNIKNIIKTHRQFQGVKINVAVKSGAVAVRITLDHPADVFFLKNRIAEIDGVISINITAKFIT